MIVPRSLYSSAPPARTKAEDNPTLLVSWWCTGFALAFIVVRLAGRYTRAEKLLREDKIIALSIIPLLARMALVHVILIWGTNNAITTDLTEAQIRNREVGSKLVLASRIMYAAFLWTAKVSISEFLRRLTDHVWKRSYEIGLQCLRWVLGLTFLAVFIATLAECHPFRKNWQVVPDPGPQCRQGYVQLITMGSSDVLTDFFLVGFPIPIIAKSNIAVKQKISLILLFGLSLVLVGITLYRVVSVIDRHSQQQYRSLLASLEILAAAVVSNALVLGSFVRDRGLKKQRYRFDSIAGSSSLDRPGGPRVTTMTARHWGSDADLVGDVGIRLQEGLSAAEMPGPRPAPKVTPLASPANHGAPSIDHEDWVAFQDRSSAEAADEIEGQDRHKNMKNSSSQLKKKTPSSRRLSFFDVGGLLDDDGGAGSSPACYPTLTKQSQASSMRFLSRVGTETEEYSARRNRHGKNALLQDIGGLLTSSEPAAAPARRDRDHHQSSNNKGSGRSPGPLSIRGEKRVTMEPPDVENGAPAPSLNDVGRLLA